MSPSEASRRRRRRRVEPRIAGRVLHDFRRTAVRNLVRAGVAERVAMQMVGWKSRDMLDRYHIVSAADLIEAAEKLDAAPGRLCGMPSAR